MVEGTGIHATKTMFQTRLALIVAQMIGGIMDQIAFGSAVIMVCVASLGTSFARIGKTVEKQKEKRT